MPLNFPELRIASRKSKLALLQAEIKKIKIITYQTSGDKIQNKPLFAEGAKGLYSQNTGFGDILIRGKNMQKPSPRKFRTIYPIRC